MFVLFSFVDSMTLPFPEKVKPTLTQESVLWHKLNAYSWIALEQPLSHHGKVGSSGQGGVPLGHEI